MLPENRISTPMNSSEKITYNAEATMHETNNNDFDEANRFGTDGTPIQSFYSGQSIFITGGTGFLGKVLIEKLLRSCPGISTIYVLARAKRGKNVKCRIEELFQNQIFDRLKKEVPQFRDKVVAINGDCSLGGLGLSETDRELLIQKVSIVFHAAATVRFDENLKVATMINVQSTLDILEMCKCMRKLKSFIHVSTAYANCHLKHIGECFYEYPIKYEELFALVNTLPEKMIDEITPSIIRNWRNTYTFTKAIAESVIKEKNKGLPMGIYRPAIVISAAKEPIPGWVDNYYGPTGITAGVCVGVVRVVRCDPDVIANIIPVDITVNGLIASAWDVYEQKNRRDEDMLIYNSVPNTERPLLWSDYCRYNLIHNVNYPLDNCIWYRTFIMVRSKTLYTLGILLFHIFPALVIDTICMLCTSQKARFLKKYEKVHKFSNLLSYFCLHNWFYTHENIDAMWLRLNAKDQQLFDFNMKNFDWFTYFHDYVKGIRAYLFQQGSSTLEESKKRFKRLFWAHQLLMTLLCVTGLWMLWSVFSAIFM